MEQFEYCLLFSFKKKNTSVNITKINVNSKDITDPSQICNEFNNYFCTIGDSLFSKLPSTDGCRANFMGYCNPSSLSSMVCDSVDQYELLALIATLDNSKSPGHKGVASMRQDEAIASSCFRRQIFAHLFHDKANVNFN